MDFCFNLYLLSSKARNPYLFYKIVVVQNLLKLSITSYFFRFQTKGKSIFLDCKISNLRYDNIWYSFQKRGQESLALWFRRVR